MTVLTPTDRDWTQQQERLTRLSGNLTTAGAVTLGALMAGKTKAGRKVLPKKIHRKLNTDAADDTRNAIALASMVAGAASARKWANKMRDDVAVSDALNDMDRAHNYAKAMEDDIFKAIIPSAVVRYRSGLRRTRTATFRRSYLPRPPSRFRRRRY
jgi:hypothetical protein